jgi:hypothetical protein
MRRDRIRHRNAVAPRRHRTDPAHISTPFDATQRVDNAAESGKTAKKEKKGGVTRNERTRGEDERKEGKGGEENKREHQRKEAYQ